jgi:trimeric autotransporter adhesin
MKRNFLLMSACVLLTLHASTQNLAINVDGSLPNPHAILDIKSGNKGLLIPRMSSVARQYIPNTKGLLVYDTTTNSFWYNTGTQWQSLATGTAALAAMGPWLVTGNSGTDSTNFLGTTDNVPLNIRVNNIPSGRIDHINNNTFWGYGSGISTTGQENTGTGHEALHNNTTGSYNTATGFLSMHANTTGHRNTAYGRLALRSNTTGHSNTAVGMDALTLNTTGARNTALGMLALLYNTTGHDNTATGFDALASNNSGNGNTATGTAALRTNTGGLNNTAIGVSALYGNNTGSDNTATGARALATNSGSSNTASGSYCMWLNGTGSYNTVSGDFAMYANQTGNYNTASGSHAMSNNNSGDNNTATGNSALSGNDAGHFNTATGAHSMQFNFSGLYNTAAGAYALESNYGGTGNTAVGYRAMSNYIPGHYNTAVGYEAGVSGTQTNATAIGAGALVDASNKVRIGNSAVTVIEGQVPFTTPSDGRFKFNIQDDVKGLDFILQLRPVTYQFDVKQFDAQLNPNTDVNQVAYEEAAQIRRTGFIAQEVEQAAITTNYNFSGIIKPKTDKDHYSLSYDAFVVPLVKAIQEQHQTIGMQQKKIAEQQAKIEEQDKKFLLLQQQLDELKKLMSPSR